MQTFEIRGLIYDPNKKEWIDRRVSFELFPSNSAATKALKADDFQTCMNPYVCITKGN